MAGLRHRRRDRQGATLLARVVKLGELLIGTRFRIVVVRGIRGRSGAVGAWRGHLCVLGKDGRGGAGAGRGTRLVQLGLEMQHAASQTIHFLDDLGYLEIQAQTKASTQVGERNASRVAVEQSPSFTSLSKEPRHKRNGDQLHY